MPNWCQNQLTVTGATPELRAWLKKKGFSFEKMNPPRKPRKTRNVWASPDMYYNAWGTKWDLPENEQREVASDLLDHGSAFFDTAWSPPMQAIGALSRMFPAVTFQLNYCELGMFFAGTTTYSDGECHNDFHGEQAGVIKIACDIFGHEDEEPCEIDAVA
jgi:hypothetical protein